MGNSHSRRAFIGQAAAAAALTTFGSSTQLGARPSTGPGAGRLTLGVASYSMREFTLDQALDMARRLGVTSMTFKDVHIPRTDPPETTRACTATGPPSTR